MPLLSEKCSVRKVSFADHNNFFSAELLSLVEKTWSQWLAPLVPNLPTYEQVIQELRPQIAMLLE